MVDCPAAWRVTSLAFYLPQFHPIPENDHWWGTGFTDWTNVRAAQPHFVWHEQPLLPGELGYYDLRGDDIHDQQAALATEYHIDVFVYYHYWFHGRRAARAAAGTAACIRRDRGLPFCLCWANESWSRRWDGGNEDVLIAQTYSPKTTSGHVTSLRHPCVWEDDQ